LETNGEALSTPFANDRPAYDYFVGKGLVNFQGAAVVGNLDQESGVDPTIRQHGGGPGRGLAQWSAGGRWDTTPGDNLVAFAAMRGLPTSSLMVQLDFIWYELETFPEYGLAKLRATTNVTDATAVFEDNFEGCVYANFPVCNLPQRVTFAKNVLAAFGSDPVSRDAGNTPDSALPVDGKAIRDDASAADDKGTTNDGAVTSDATPGEAMASGAFPDTPRTHDAEAPHQTSDAAPASSEGTRTSADVDSGGCSVQASGASGSSRGCWLAAMGLVLATSRRRRRCL
jgi:MYXO-CTERM domain-containing protein